MRFYISFSGQQMCTAVLSPVASCSLLSYLRTDPLDLLCCVYSLCPYVALVFFVVVILLATASMRLLDCSRFLRLPRRRSFSLGHGGSSPRSRSSH